MSRKLLVGTIFLSLFFAACEGNSSGDEENVPRTLRLNLTGVEPLPNGFHYEGWVLTSGAANASTGKFNVDAGGNLVDLNGNLIANGAFETNLSLSPTFFITIESAGDTDQTPSPTRFLGGDVNDGMAALTVEHRNAIGASLFLGTGTARFE